MLDKILSGKAVAVSPFISEINEGMGGGSTPQDLETMFQLIYLRFTQPRAEPDRRLQSDSGGRTQPEPPPAAAGDPGHG